MSDPLGFDVYWEGRALLDQLLGRVSRDENLDFVEVLEGKPRADAVKWAVVEVSDGRKAEAPVNKGERWEDVTKQLVLQLADDEGNLSSFTARSEWR